MDNGVSLADIAAVTDRNGYGNGNGMWGMEWIFALLILPMIWGNNGPFNNRGDGNPVTESDLCNANSFNELKSSVGRGFDQQTQFAFQNQRDMCQSTATLSAQIASAAAAQERCCCDTKSLIQQTQYENAQNTAAINANTTAQIQSVKDLLCQQESARKDARIWQLELNQAMCGVVRYPNQTTYGAPNPFFGWNNCNNNCCNNGFGNI